MGVSPNSGTPKSSILRGFPLFSPSILGENLLFLVQHPYVPYYKRVKHPTPAKKTKIKWRFFLHPRYFPPMIPMVYGVYGVCVRKTGRFNHWSPTSGAFEVSETSCVARKFGAQGASEWINKDSWLENGPGLTMHFHYENWNIPASYVSLPGGIFFLFFGGGEVGVCTSYICCAPRGIARCVHPREVQRYHEQI